MTTILDLPKDLIEEIISRVPLLSMRAVRLTCKKWDTLSKSQSFSKMHLAKIAAATREGESQTIMLMDYKLYLMSIVFNGTDVDPAIEPIGKLNCLNDSDQIEISQVFNCEGLLLCILKDTLRLVVWNPYWGQTMWIEPRHDHQKLYEYRDWYRYSLGYVNKKNKSCGSHKVLRFMDDLFVPYIDFFWYEIYDFDSGLWKTLDVTPHWDILCQHGVSLKGNTYFCATKRKSFKLNDHIICFDFTNERFGPLLPMPFNARWHNYVTLSCVREEKLAVLLLHSERNPYEVDIWITSKIEAENVSWSKFLTLDTQPAYPISSQSFYINEENKITIGFDGSKGYNHYILSIVGEAGYLKQLNLQECANLNSRFKGNIRSYIPSLVQIKKFRNVSI